MSTKNQKLLKITLLLVSMMTMLANAIVSPVLPLIKDVFCDTPNAELLAKLMMTIPALTIAILAPFVGKVIDKWGRKKLLIASLAIYAIAGTSGAWIDTLPYILIGRLFLGLGVAGTMTTTTTLIGDYFNGEKRNSFISMQGAFSAFGGFLFITSAGYLADIHWRLPFLIYGFSLLVMIIAPISLYEPNISKKKHASKRPIYFSKESVWLVYLSAFISIAFFYIVPVQIPFYIKTFQGVTNSMSGWAIGAFTITQAITAFSYKKVKNKFSFQKIYAICFTIMGVGFTIMSQSSTYFMAIISTLILGAGTGWLFPNANLWIISIAPNSVRGKYVGYLNTSIFFGMFCSPLLIQPIQEAMGISLSFLAIGTMLFALAILYGVSKK